MTDAREAIVQQIARDEDLLTEAMQAFADYEAILNPQIKAATDAEERARLFEQRAECERALGIEMLVERIDDAKRFLREIDGDA
jgi:hypothetical protein